MEIEGNWKDFIITLGTVNESEEISKHVNENFLRDEPMNKYLGFSEKCSYQHYLLIKHTLSQGLSLIARHKDTNEIVGVNLALDARLPNLESVIDENDLCPQLRTIFSFIGKLEKNTEERFRAEFPCSFHAEIFISSVSKNFRGFGIAKELYLRSLNLLKSKDFPCVKISLTSPGTRAIVKSLNFTTLGTIEFSEGIFSTGEIVNEEDYAAEVVKML